MEALGLPLRGIGALLLAKIDDLIKWRKASTYLATLGRFFKASGLTGHLVVVSSYSKIAARDPRANLEP